MVKKRSPVSQATHFGQALVILAFAFASSGARADLMGEALNNYSRGMNEYFKQVSSAGTDYERQQLSDRLIKPAGQGIQKALEEQTDRTMTKFGIGLVGDSRPTGKEVKKVSVAKIKEYIDQAGTKEAVAKRVPANTPARPQVETSEPAPSSSDGVVVSGDQKIDRIVYPGKGAQVSGPSSIPSGTAAPRTATK